MDKNIKVFRTVDLELDINLLTKFEIFIFILYKSFRSINIRVNYISGLEKSFLVTVSPIMKKIEKKINYNIMSIGLFYNNFT